MTIKIAVAGCGAIGAAVCRALIDGIDGFSLVAASDLSPEQSRALVNRPSFDLRYVPLADIVSAADWVVEALPAAAVPPLAAEALSSGKTLVMISSAALLLYPEIIEMSSRSHGRILVPSGALAGMDGINALAEQGIREASLVSSKPPQAFRGAPFIAEQMIDLDDIAAPQTLFSGNALQAAAAFPANVNVAATLSIATRLAPEEVKVQVRADPALLANVHEVTVHGDFSTLTFRLENRPDPANPKSSALAAASIIALLRRQQAPLWVG